MIIAYISLRLLNYYFLNKLFIHLFVVVFTVFSLQQVKFMLYSIIS